MADLKIPNITNNSKQYLFKDKISSRKKTKTKLLKESIFMFLISSFLIFINHLIPKKYILLTSFSGNLVNIYDNFLEFFFYFYEIILVVFMFVSLSLSLILISGSISRIYKLINIKSKKNKYY